MSVIVEFDVDADSFELGRALAVPGRSDVELEDVVPLGSDVVPLFWLYETDATEFVETVEENDAVETVVAFDETEDRTLYALQWDATRDRFLGAIAEFGGFLLSATGSGETWTLRVRFPDHDALSAFNDRCAEADVTLDVTGLYNRTHPSAGRHYGLTETQYETLLLARRRGYYDIPRGVTTQALADELGVSDQAVTERLRRAVRTLTDNALRPSADDSTPD
ncbi:putative DNA binding protein [Halarchaeum rubridurum]|uniref:Bacteriocin n=1 Tax=Halarchaeum rubridurum TaxID=489911 RepID=A0A830FS69_9EURY|nr:helix-turn-helix domain-containing protein [Halarchaeum rubridurum]MBP1953663.1 putative DNA binding protein [Halarchaeum rubridurum]GGM53679.1 bacteriocin [Halarchaeum rubridurum]